jgi:2-C-methyl-D-erythritol 4-phosphate cytidylyltransferase
MRAAVIIAASGQGERMGTEVRKQYLPLEGIPILARSVNIFVEHSAVAQVIVVIPPGDAVYARKILKSFCPLEKINFVEGGRRRQDSIYNGLQILDGEAELVCIHDGVRPLVTKVLIDAVLDAASAWGAALPVIPVTDTLKEVAENGLVKGTLPRAALRCAQTPQVFRQELIREAYRKAVVLGVEATDDAYLLELLGEPVYTVPGDPANIKITSPHDLLVASALLKKER